MFSLSKKPYIRTLALAWTITAQCGGVVAIAKGAESLAARDALIACLFVNAERTDDHISDAATIGNAIIPLCGPEIKSWEAASSRGLDRAGSVGIARGIIEGLPSVAISVVLKEREFARTQKH